MPVFEQRFEGGFRNEFDAVMFLLLPFPTIINYAANDDAWVFELLLTIDKMLIETKVLPPLVGQYLLRKR